MGLSNNCASSAATASVDQHEVGAASGISNMARYVAAAAAVVVHTMPHVGDASPARAP